MVRANLHPVPGTYLRARHVVRQSAMLYARLALGFTAVSHAAAFGVAPLAPGRLVTRAAPPAVWMSGASVSSSSSSVAADDCECGPSGGEAAGVVMNDVDVNGATLRALELVDADGRTVAVGDVLGDRAKGVVVFLRHLG